MKYIFFISILSIVLLSGAACGRGNTDAAPPAAPPRSAPEASAPPAPTTPPQRESPDAQEEDAITLRAEAIGNGQVRLQWELADKTAQPEGFRIVRSKNPNPVHNRINYWWEPNPALRQMTWRNVATGTQHIRICIVENDECTVYSDDVVVDVQ